MPKVYWHEANVRRCRREFADALTLFSLRVRVVHLEYRDVTQLAHPPSAPVESGAENDELWIRRRADCVVDRDGANRHHLAGAREIPVFEALLHARGLRARAEALHFLARVVGQERKRGRITEPRDVRLSMRGSATGADHRRGSTRLSWLHAKKTTRASTVGGERWLTPRVRSAQGSQSAR